MAIVQREPDENPYAATSTSLEQDSFSADAVVLASRFKRLVARIVDDLLRGIFVIAALLVWLGPSGLLEYALGSGSQGGQSGLSGFLFDFSQTTLFALLLGLAITFILQGYLLQQYGQTIGKRLLGIRIVDKESHEKPSLTITFLVRECGMGLLGLSMPLTLINACWIFGTPRRCLHDYWSGTVVVNVHFRRF